MDYQSIIDKYYPSENELRRILLIHSRQVADRCLKIAKTHPELKLDVEFLEEAAMLHDIGIFRCDAPSIQCFGSEPYICHGAIGGQILREEGWPRHALVCERHTGTGLSREQIESQQLPLSPDGIYEPEALEILSSKKGGKYNIIKIDENYTPAPIEHKKDYYRIIR